MAKNEQEDLVRWHHLDVKDVIERLRTDQHRGLTLAEAERRLARDGPNRLPLPSKGRDGCVSSYNSTTY